MILVVPTDTWPHHVYREYGDDERSTAEALAGALRRNGVAVEVVEVAGEAAREATRGSGATRRVARDRRARGEGSSRQNGDNGTRETK